MGEGRQVFKRVLWLRGTTAGEQVEIMIRTDVVQKFEWQLLLGLAPRERFFFGRLLFS